MKITKFLVASALVLLAGCSTGTKEPQKIDLLVPQGATALATLSIYNNAYANVTTVSGSDPVTAELAKADSEYEVIIAPINLGAKMMEKGNTEYRLAAVISWGNLYVVGTPEYQEGDPIAAFGENAVPQKIIEATKIEGDITYFNGVQEVQAQLLGGKFTAGVMAEPAVTATIAKAKENGLELAVKTNLQERYEGVQEETPVPGTTSSGGYPQAAVFVKSGSEEMAADALKQMELFLNETASDADQVTQLFDQAGAENLGVPNAKVAVASWQRQNLKYVAAEDSTTEISAFLKLFNITFSKDMLSK